MHIAYYAKKVQKLHSFCVFLHKIVLSQLDPI